MLPLSPLPGEEYEGEWQADRRHGEGRGRTAAGDEYVGSWAGGKREGAGRMKWVHGDVYEGGWRRDRMHGEAGTVRLPRQPHEQGP